MGNTEFIIEPGRQDIVMTRVFDASPDVVYQAITDPEHIANWWGSAKHPTTIDHAEFRRGGAWRFIDRDDAGTEFAFRGIVHDVSPPNRIIWTFEFEGMPGHVSLETVTLEEVDGGTKYTAVAVYQSVEDRDGMVQAGMEGGAAESMDRLAEVIKAL